MNQPKNSNLFNDDGDEFETTSIFDLIEFLQQFQGNMSVLASWEGQWVPFGNAKIIKEVNGDAALLINVDGSQYDCFEDPLLYPQVIE